MVLVAHPPSKRRAAAQYFGLKKILSGPKRLAPASGGKIKLLVAPPFSGGSLSMGQALIRAGDDLGLQCQIIEWEEDLKKEAEKLKDNPTENKSTTIFKQAAKQAAKITKVLKPDLFLALAQAPLDAEGLDLIRENSPDTILAFWFVEDFRRFKYVSDVAPAYDLFFHIQGDLLNQSLKNWGHNRAWYLPVCADPFFFKPQNSEDKYRAHLSFMGQGYPNRRFLLSELAKNYWAKSSYKTSDFKIFGSGWDQVPEHLKPHIFEGGRRVGSEECQNIFAGSKVSLNIHSGDQKGFDTQSAFVNPRTFELAASSALQLVDNRPLLFELFSENEVKVVNDPKELPHLIDYFLSRPEEALMMGQEARKRVLKEHQYIHRLKFILDCAR
jgi:spore maturation protein CgeB